MCPPSIFRGHVWCTRGGRLGAEGNDGVLAKAPRKILGGSPEGIPFVTISVQRREQLPQQSRHTSTHTCMRPKSLGHSARLHVEAVQRRWSTISQCTY